METAELGRVGMGAMMIQETDLTNANWRTPKLSLRAAGLM